MYTGTTGWVPSGAGPNEPLRSHGGVSEKWVLFTVNRAVDFLPEVSLRNFDIYNLLPMDILHGGRVSHQGG